MAITESDSSLLAAGVERADPPRFWWTKRIGVAVVVVIVALGVLRWWWGHEADRRLAALVSDARARGEPVLPEDFAPPVVADSDNASILFSQAASALVWDPQIRSLERTPPSEFEPLSTEQLQLIAKSMAANSQSLKLARQASTRPSDSWSLPSSRQSKHNWVMQKASLGRLLKWVAVYCHQTGDDFEALYWAKVLIRMADSIDSGPDAFLDHLFSISVQSLAIEGMNRLARWPSLSPSEMPQVIRQELRDLITLLLREEYYHREDVRAAYHLRDGRIEYLSELKSSTTNWDEILLMPMYQLDLLRSADTNGKAARALEAPTWPAASARLSQDETLEGSTLYRYTRLDTRISDAGSVTYISRFFRASNIRRAAAVSLAILLYRSDHHGQYPRTLDDLVPAYLASVPQDAMAPDGRPLGYRPENRPPIIYDIGYGGKYTNDIWSESGRTVFPLEPLPKRPRPASRPAQNHQRDQNNSTNQAPAKAK